MRKGSTKARGGLKPLSYEESNLEDDDELSEREDCYDTIYSNLK